MGNSLFNTFDFYIQIWKKRSEKCNVITQRVSESRKIEPTNCTSATNMKTLEQNSVAT